MSDVFQNLQLQRIADGIQGGGQSVTVNIDVTGAGDMQGATSSAAGVHGLVPAPAAGDEDKVLIGSGAWVEQSGGGINYSLTEQDTGLKWIDGSIIYQRTFDISGKTYAQNRYVEIATVPNIAILVSAECVVYEGSTGTLAPEAFQRIHVTGTGAIEIYCTTSYWNLTAGSHLTVRYTKSV